MGTFLPFHPVVNKWFKDRFCEPSPPQRQGWPAIASSRHTLILAPTGSGKTLAAFLWCIDEIYRKGLTAEAKDFAHNPEGVHTLYISPLKALNNDIHNNLQEPLQGIGNTAETMGYPAPIIRVMVRTGDTPSRIRQSMVKKPPHILITTPESLYLLISSPRSRQMFKNLRYIIVDEIHAVCNNKRGVHLSLSIERLAARCHRDPVRIGLSATQKPLHRIAAFLGGSVFDRKDHGLTPRPVTIVDCGRRKEMDVRVLSPVEDFADLPEATVWPAVIEKLYQLIRQHKSTLVFVNMRAQTERVARQLNDLHKKITGDAEAEIARAHHGSISREGRHRIEAKLKTGEIPAVIATGSLELGIDIGSIELVVQLESPRSITSALQRVGRSGHLLTAKSKGRIIPLYPADLDDAVALTEAMIEGDIEETTIPENCLDVLAQHLVAEIAMQPMPRAELFRLVRQSYCYRYLSEAAFNSVVEMIAGRYQETDLQTLKPRVTWDRVNDMLIPRRGARMLAIMNAGTIPDRGYYSVYLADENVRLGEMEEEFVFESRVGDVFFLGSNEWRIQEITRDRIIVQPAHSLKPRAPFWKGDLLYRDFSTQLKVGRFRRRFLHETAKGYSASKWMNENIADEAAVRNLYTYLHRQQSHSGVVADDKRLVVEYFQDASGEPYLMIHAPFGARVNGAWAIALAAVLESQYQKEVQYQYDDDGLLIRLLNTSELPPIEQLFALSGDEIENLLVTSLADTPIFAIHFRYNATRALLLQRSVWGKRIPLWLQRLRSADLLQIVRKYPEFPVVIETLRECLHDIFDLSALRSLIHAIRAKEIALHFIRTSSPSPMSSGLMFRFLSSQMYENDRSRTPGSATHISSDLLAEVMSQGEIAAIISRNVVQEAEARWQYLTDEARAKDQEDLFAIIEALGPIETGDLQPRCIRDLSEWLDALKKSGRIVHLNSTLSGWIAVEDEPIYADHHAAGTHGQKVRRYLQTRGPVTLGRIAHDLALGEDEVMSACENLFAADEVVRGRLTEDAVEEQWCDRHRFVELYRRSIAERRKAETPTDRDTFYRFLINWHGVSQPERSVIDLVEQYRGYKFPPLFFEREILRTRLLETDGIALTDLQDELHRLIASGEVMVRAIQVEDKTPYVEFFLRGEGNLFFSKEKMIFLAERLSEKPSSVFSFLQENGASLLRDISEATDLSMAEVNDALSVLIRKGLVTCDHYPAFLLMLQKKESSPLPKSGYSLANRPGGRFHDRYRRRRRNIIRQRVQQRLTTQEGRWFTTISFSVLGKQPREDVTERTARLALSLARLLLQRYGILIKDWHRHERGLLPWYPIFGTLKRLEWQGEIRRGYFVRGLSGIQFAHPEALELLRKVRKEKQASGRQAVLISTMDPALPFGRAVPWDLKDMNGGNIPVLRLPGNHLVFIRTKPVAYSENFGNRLWFLNGFARQDAAKIAGVLKMWLMLPASLRPRKKVEIATVNGEPAGQCPFAQTFLDLGYERDGSKLVLWPSRA